VRKGVGGDYVAMEPNHRKKHCGHRRGKLQI
jgi:hypothetical protein